MKYHQVYIQYMYAHGLGGEVLDGNRIIIRVPRGPGEATTFPLTPSCAHR